METERITLSQRERDRLKVLHQVQQKHLFAGSSSGSETELKLSCVAQLQGQRSVRRFPDSLACARLLSHSPRLANCEQRHWRI
jgi:hypothetical protein